MSFWMKVVSLSQKVDKIIYKVILRITRFDTILIHIITFLRFIIIYVKIHYSK